MLWDFDIVQEKEAIFNIFKTTLYFYLFVCLSCLLCFKNLIIIFVLYFNLVVVLLFTWKFFLTWKLFLGLLCLFTLKHQWKFLHSFLSPSSQLLFFVGWSVLYVYCLFDKFAKRLSNDLLVFLFQHFLVNCLMRHL